MVTAVSEFLTRKANRELIRYAVSRAMFCGSCSSILDMRRAVLTSFTVRAAADGGMVCTCAACFDTKIGPGIPGVIAALAAKNDGASVRHEVIDGREVFKSPPRNRKVAR